MAWIVHGSRCFGGRPLPCWFLKFVRSKLRALAGMFSAIRGHLCTNCGRSVAHLPKWRLILLSNVSTPERSNGRQRIQAVISGVEATNGTRSRLSWLLPNLNRLRTHCQTMLSEPQSRIAQKEWMPIPALCPTAPAHGKRRFDLCPNSKLNLCACRLAKAVAAPPATRGPNVHTSPSTRARAAHVAMATVQTRPPYTL